MKWTDSEQIAIALHEKSPSVDPADGALHGSAGMDRAPGGVRRRPRGLQRGKTRGRSRWRGTRSGRTNGIDGRPRPRLRRVHVSAWQRRVDTRRARSPRAGGHRRSTARRSGQTLTHAATPTAHVADRPSRRRQQGDSPRPGIRSTAGRKPRAARSRALLKPPHVTTSKCVRQLSAHRSTIFKGIDLTTGADPVRRHDPQRVHEARRRRPGAACRRNGSRLRAYALTPTTTPSDRTAEPRVLSPRPASVFHTLFSSGTGRPLRRVPRERLRMEHVVPSVRPLRPARGAGHHELVAHQHVDPPRADRRHRGQRLPRALAPAARRACPAVAAAR